MTGADLREWQQEFKTQPVVYEVYIWFEGTQESTGNIYDCEAAAQLEVDWINARRPRHRPKLVRRNVHNLDLSQRRWRKQAA